MSVGERIKLIRGSVRQDAFSVKVGVHLNTVGRWERDQSTPDAADLNKILAAYPDINPTWLLTGEGEMRRGGSLLPHVNFATVGKKIREVRGELTPSQFIEKLGVILTEERLLDIEAGKIEPGYGLLNLICSDFEVSGSWLVGDTADMSGDETDKGGVDLKLLDFAIMAVDSLDFMKNENEPPMTSQKKAFLSTRLYEHLRKKGFDWEKESPLEEIIRLETEKNK